MTQQQQQWRVGKRVAVMGGGPGGISTALAFHARGFDVRVFERQKECTAIGGAVLLSVPVLAVLRSYGIDIDNFGSFTVTHFMNNKGTDRVILPFNPKVEEAMGIKGWHYGVLRSSAFQKMLDKVPEGMITSNAECVGYHENDKEVTAKFKDGSTVQCDLIVGADGIRSAVSQEMFGDPKIFHCGIRLWLAWCDPIPDIPANMGAVCHDDKYQASFFPMTHHEGKPGYEWWIVEPSSPTAEAPTDVKAHLQGILNNFADPLPRFPDATNFDTQVYRWEIYNRPALDKWSKGRAVCVGDAVHPVSPYAAYGMGMAIEDGYYLARAFDGIDLSDKRAMAAAFEVYESERVDYVNHNMLFARRLGYVFHQVPWPLSKLRDLVFDHTPFMSHFMKSGYLQKSELETLALKELHVRRE